MSDGGESIGVRHPTRGDGQLRGVAAAVWRRADGSRSVEELAAAIGVEVSTVWAALDELGDAELLTERVGPPAGVHESVHREVSFGEAAVSSPDAAAQLEAQFDADAAKGEQDVKLPQADANRRQQAEARQDAEEGAAHADALTRLEGRPDDGAPAASHEETEAHAAESRAKSERLAAEVDESEQARAEAAEALDDNLAHAAEEHKKSERNADDVLASAESRKSAD